MHAISLIMIVKLAQDACHITHYDSKTCTRCIVAVLLDLIKTIAVIKNKQKVQNTHVLCLIS